MATTVVADDKPVPALGWLWLLAYAVGFSVLLRYCAPFPPPLPGHSRLVLPCAYCAVALDDQPASFVRSCSGGCDESV